MNYKKIFSLRNKKIFVVGGSGLIGNETIKCLNTFGAKTVNIDLKKNINSKYNFTFNTSDSDNLNQNLNRVIKKFGVPHVLINCSYPKNDKWSRNTFLNNDNSSFSQNVNDHFVSYVLLSKKIANLMVKSKIKGSIILLSSIYGVVGQDQNIYKKTKIKENIAYSVIKGGLINFTKQMASFYGKYDLRINCVCPGGVIDKINSKDLNFIINYKKRVPLKRLAKSSEVASTILFLSSNASSYITGSTIMVDGGWTCI